MDDVADAAAAGDKNAAKARHSPPATCYLLPCAPTTYHYVPPTYSDPNPNPNPNQGGVDQGPGLRQRLPGHRQPRDQRQGGRQVRADRGQHLSMGSESLGEQDETTVPAIHRAGSTPPARSAEFLPPSSAIVHARPRPYSHTHGEPWHSGDAARHRRLQRNLQRRVDRTQGLRSRPNRPGPEQTGRRGSGGGRHRLRRSRSLRGSAHRLRLQDGQPRPRLLHGQETVRVSTLSCSRTRPSPFQGSSRADRGEAAGSCRRTGRLRPWPALPWRPKAHSRAMHTPHDLAKGAFSGALVASRRGSTSSVGGASREPRRSPDTRTHTDA
eukprot:scaffold18079_cov65-Phaeocystis_antarctica.AAC.16